MKKVEYYENEKLKSKQIVSNISSSLKQINRQISELDKSKQKTDDLIKKFDIDCYKYNLVDEMNTSKTRLENNIRNMINKLNLINIKDSDNVELSIKKVDYINDILNNSDIQLKALGQESLSNIEKLQMNAIKKGIYDKFMLIKSSIDRDKLKRKFDKRRGKSYVQKLINKFFEVEEKPDSKKENIFIQIHEIDKVREEIIKNKEPSKEYKIIEILADIDIFLMDNEFDSKYKDEINEIKELRTNINNIFSIDNKKLRQEIAKKRQEKLPVKVDKNVNKVIKDRQKSIAFLTKNGYIVNNSTEENTIKSKMVGVIRKINIISESIEKILKA